MSLKGNKKVFKKWAKKLFCGCRDFCANDICHNGNSLVKATPNGVSQCAVRPNVITYFVVRTNANSTNVVWTYVIRTNALIEILLYTYC